jgi:death-on-curing protein
MVRRKRHEPIWIDAREAEVINHRLVALFGGVQPGIKDETLFHAALARPLNKWAYDHPAPDIFALAAAYCFAIVGGHVFLDGNKRTGHAVAAVFLENNGITHAPQQSEIVDVMVRVASGKMSEKRLAAWFRKTSKARTG